MLFDPITHFQGTVVIVFPMLTVSNGLNNHFLIKWLALRWML
jgi:hypothetical protein